MSSLVVAVFPQIQSMLRKYWAAHSTSVNAVIIALAKTLTVLDHFYNARKYLSRNSILKRFCIDVSHETSFAIQENMTDLYNYRFNILCSQEQNYDKFSRLKKALVRLIM